MKRKKNVLLYSVLFPTRLEHAIEGVNYRPDYADICVDFTDADQSGRGVFR